MSKARKYTLYIKRSAERELDVLPKTIFDRVVKAILALQGSPRPRNAKKLRGSDAFRIRIGDYRVLYTVDDDARRIDIVAVGHRRSVYRGI